MYVCVYIYMCVCIYIYTHLSDLEVKLEDIIDQTA